MKPGRMSVDVSINWIFMVLLVSVRLAVLVYATPLDAIGRVPGMIRVLIILGASVLLVNLLDMPVWGNAPSHLFELLVMGLGEVVIGLTLVLGIHAAIGSFMLAGKILDFQSGFGSAGVFNPATQSQDPLFGTVLTLLAVSLFFALDFHHYFIRGIVYSLETLPPGSILQGLMPDLVIRQFGYMFIYGVMISAPVVFMLLLIDVGVGFMARTMPQMNVYFAILPFKIMAALILLGLSIRYLQPLVERIYLDAFQYWHLSINQMSRNP